MEDPFRSMKEQNSM